VDPPADLAADDLLPIGRASFWASTAWVRLGLIYAEPRSRFLRRRLNRRLRRPHGYIGIGRTVSNIRANVSDLQVGSMALARNYAVCGSGFSRLLTARMSLHPGIALITIRCKAVGPCRDLK
jgi:hypothetical protein